MTSFTVDRCRKWSASRDTTRSNLKRPKLCPVAVVYFLFLISAHLLHIVSSAAAVDNQGAPRLIEGPPTSVEVCSNGAGGQRSLHLPCNVSGQPPLSISWWKDGVELEDETTRRVVRGEDGSLTLSWGREGVRGSMGSYQCVGRNSEGVVMSNITSVYTIDLPLVGARRPIVKEFGEGEPLALNCSDSLTQLSAQQKSHLGHIHWESSDTSMGQCINSQQPASRCKQGENDSLYFLYMMERDNGTTYQCNIEYRTCPDAQPQIVKGPIYHLKILPDPPVITHAPVLLNKESIPRSLTVLEGHKLSMQCIFGGRRNGQVPLVSWFGPRREPVPRGLVSKDGLTVTIPNATQHDHEGNFSCEAKFSDSTVTSMYIPVHVEEPASIAPPMTDLYIPYSSSSAEEVVVTCPARGRPTPSIVWYINGTVLQHYVNRSDTISVIEVGQTLRFNDLKYNTSVACSVSNSHGRVINNAHIFLTPPEASVSPSDTRGVGERTGGATFRPPEEPALSQPPSSTLPSRRSHSPREGRTQRPISPEGGVPGLGGTTTGGGDINRDTAKDQASHKDDTDSSLYLIVIGICALGVLLLLAASIGCCCYRCARQHEGYNVNNKKKKNEVELKEYKKEGANQALHPAEVLLVNPPQAAPAAPLLEINVTRLAEKKKMLSSDEGSETDGENDESSTIIGGRRSISSKTSSSSSVDTIMDMTLYNDMNSDNNESRVTVVDCKHQPRAQEKHRATTVTHM